MASNNSEDHILLQKANKKITDLKEDIRRLSAELKKRDSLVDFKDAFYFLSTCGKSVFISGPIPTLDHGAGRFSRILSLHTWLKCACRVHNIGFIDNYNLFWNRFSLFRTDGVHPNRLGSRMLAANLAARYTVFST